MAATNCCSASLTSKISIQHGVQKCSTPFLSNTSSLKIASVSSSTQQKKIFNLSPRALDLDSDTLVGIGVAVAGLAVGIGIPIFYETQLKGSEERENDQPCFPCKGTGAQSCRFCLGTGTIVVELGGGEKEVSQCINCEGKGNIVCTTCQGSGVQPRYLDRREFKDDD